MILDRTVVASATPPPPQRTNPKLGERAQWWCTCLARRRPSVPLTPPKTVKQTK